MANVDAYNSFIPFCINSQVLSSTNKTRGNGLLPVTMMEAELTVGFMAFKESYVSNVTCVPHESVQVIPYLHNMKSKG